MSDIIRIAGLHVECVVGVYPEERQKVQPLTVDIEMMLSTEAAARSEKLGDTVHYALVADQIAFLLRSCRFRLIETAAHAISTYLLAPPTEGERRALIERVRLRLTKPGALAGRAIPSIEIERTAAWARVEVEEKDFGTVDIIHETKSAGIYRLNIAPGRGIPLHVHRRMKESEMILTEGLLVQGRPMPPGTVHRWPKGLAHRYDNPTDRWQSVLCVDSPPFIASDEIVVDGEPGDARAETAWGGEVRR